MLSKIEKGAISDLGIAPFMFLGYIRGMRILKNFDPADADDQEIYAVIFRGYNPRNRNQSKLSGFMTLDRAKDISFHGSRHCSTEVVRRRVKK